MKGKQLFFCGVWILSYSILSFAERYSQSYDEPYDDNANYGVATLEERVARLEKRSSGDTLLEMSNQIEKLQMEIVKLRGTVEELSHGLDKTRRQQREMYGDFDQRFQKIMPTTAVTSPLSVTTVPAGTDPAALLPLQTGATVGTSPAGTSPTTVTTVPTPPTLPGQTAMQPFTSSVSSVPTVTPPSPVTMGTPVQSPPSPPVIDPLVRKASYEKAFNSLKEGKYNDAIRDLKAFISNYPIGEFTDSAYYWLGEAHYVNRDYPTSRDTFRKLIQNFPQSTKVADAALKLGFIEYENGQYENAKVLLNDLIKRYPETSAAKLAEKRLERMRQEKY